jgi:hypothetical protein
MQREQPSDDAAAQCSMCRNWVTSMPAGNSLCDACYLDTVAFQELVDAHYAEKQA